MITSHETPHPDDEQLSAFLDGEAASLAGHENCATCSARLAELREVSAWVATAPATPDLRPLVKRALAAVDRRATRPAPFARRQAVAMLAAAAVVAVLLGAAIFVPRGGSNSDDVAGGQGAVIDGGDLGRQDEPLALASRVRTDLTGEGIEAGTGGALAQDESAPFAGPPPAGAPSGDLSGDSSGDSPTETGPGDAPSIGSRATKAAPVTRRAKGPTPCLTEAGPAAGGGGLVYRAKTVWQGTPAVVLGFQRQGEGLTYRLVLMSRLDCRLLAVQSF